MIRLGIHIHSALYESRRRCKLAISLACQARVNGEASPDTRLSISSKSDFYLLLFFLSYFYWNTLALIHPWITTIIVEISIYWYNSLFVNVPLTWHTIRFRSKWYIKHSVAELNIYLKVYKNKLVIYSQYNIQRVFYYSSVVSIFILQLSGFSRILPGDTCCKFSFGSDVPIKFIFNSNL